MIVNKINFITIINLKKNPLFKVYSKNLKKLIIYSDLTSHTHTQTSMLLLIIFNNLL